MKQWVVTHDCNGGEYDIEVVITAKTLEKRGSHVVQVDGVLLEFEEKILKISEPTTAGDINAI